MFASKKRLVVILLVTGAVAASFMIYSAFQVDEAEAHSPFYCGWVYRLKHRPDSMNPYHSQSTTRLNKRTISGTCSVCGGSATLTSWRERTEITTERKYDHFLDTVGFYGWTYCHSHKKTKVRYGWSPPSSKCHDADCGG